MSILLKTFAGTLSLASSNIAPLRSMPTTSNPLFLMKLVSRPGPHPASRSGGGLRCNFPRGQTKAATLVVSVSLRNREGVGRGQPTNKCMAEGGEFELLARFSYLILFSCSGFLRRHPAVGSGPTSSQPRTCQQSLEYAVSLPCGQSFSFLFATCPDFVPAPFMLGSPHALQPEIYSIQQKRSLRRASLLPPQQG
jgi:hypothetical protein